ncbi:MAG: hypothetical protein CBB68_12245 [Rhodospirillaceae bacterium TMED8]|nr:hypothetical protein [Magnetovibrio sp.]OUT48884.1 MAG: hypothetical protein CBB68_12245 [Rhodospirillaceae bacterium TMED8]
MLVFTGRKHWIKGHGCRPMKFVVNILVISLSVSRLVGPAIIFVMTAAAVYAAENIDDNKSEKALTILGVTVSPLNRRYLVLKDANVRALPKTASKRVMGLKAGDHVFGVGRVKGPWIAVRKDKTPIGFVYQPILMPIIDGALANPIKGSVAIADKRCKFKIIYRGKTGAKTQKFEFADYEVYWVCANPVASSQKKELGFCTPMFFTEGPHQGTVEAEHQITVDLLELGSDLEDVFSTHLLWNWEQGQVKFDAGSVPNFVKKKVPKSRKAMTLHDALVEAASMAARSWTKEAWLALNQKQID